MGSRTSAPKVRLIAVVALVMASLTNVAGRPENAAAAGRSGPKAWGRSCPAVGRVVQTGSWISIKPPPSTWDAEGFGWYTVNPSRPEEIYAQPGFPGHPETETPAIYYSNDGGCRWIQRTIPQLTRLNENDEQGCATHLVWEDTAYCNVLGVQWVSTVIPERDPGIVYVLLRAELEKGDSPILLSSRDQGRSWETLDLSDLGVHERAATPVTLQVAPSDPRRLYLSLVTHRNPAETCLSCYKVWPERTADTLYVSKDGGETWDLAYSEPVTALPATDDLASPSDWRPWGWRDLTIDPLDPDDLWMIGRAGKILLWDMSSTDSGRPPTQLWHSTDGGSSWAFVDLGGVRLDVLVGRAVDVFHERGTTARVVVRADSFQNDSEDGLLWSADGGKTWTLVPTPDQQCAGGHMSMPKAGAVGPAGTMICVGGTVRYGTNSSSSWDVFRLDRRTGRFMKLYAPGAQGFLSIDSSRRPTIHVLGDHLLKYTPRR